MINEKISGKQVINIMILFTLGSSLITGGSLKAEQDSWLSIIIGLAAAIPIVLVYARMNKLEPNKDLFELSYMVLGKVGGSIVTFLFSIYAISLGTMIIRNFTEYIQVVSFPDTPQSLIAIGFSIIMFLTVYKGIEVLGRGSVFIIPIVLFVIFLLVLLSIKNMNLDNLKPVLYQNFKPVLSGAYSLLSFPFAETVLFITVFASVDTKENPSKLYLAGIFISGFIVFVILLWNILVLGFPLLKVLYFPLYSNAGLSEIGIFFSRIEVLISGSFLVCGLVKSTVCLYVGCKGLAKLFNINDHKKLSAPISLIMMVGSVYIYKDTMQMFKFVDIYILYAPFFQIVIPVLILILMEVLIKKKKKAGESAETASS